VIGLKNILVSKKSRIMFPFHDCIVFEIHNDEKDLVGVIKSFMEGFYKDKVFFATFPVSVKCGSNFGELEAFND